MTRRDRGMVAALSVLLVALAPHQTAPFQALDQRRDRAGIEEQPLPQRLDRQTIGFPQHQEHQVLRIGQPKRVEPGLVEAGKGMLGRIDGEA